MFAESASLKIGFTTLKVRNLSTFHSDFEQTDFLRYVSPIFLTLTSQGDNQGMLTSYREIMINCNILLDYFYKTVSNGDNVFMHFFRTCAVVLQACIVGFYTFNGIGVRELRKQFVY